MTRSIGFTGGSAVLSECGTHRYNLTRYIEGGSREGTALFVMLNPSTADANTNDATIVRCMGYARRWDYSALEVVNLFAFRSTDPANLKVGNTRDRAVGPDNDKYILEATQRADLIVCAWGVHGGLYDRDVEVAKILRSEGKPLCALKLTRWGKPSHPLYLRSDLNPISFG